MESAECPKLRMIEALPVELDGRRCILLRDPARLTSRDLVMAMEAAFILNLMNGKNSVLDIKAEVTRITGYELAGDTVRQLIDTLDENLMLENERSRESLDQLRDAFREQTVRNAFHAGLAYPADPSRLHDLLDGFCTHEKGPGRFSANAGTESVSAIVAPHIDLNAGGPTFACAYHALARSNPPDRFVILGTGHQGTGTLFALTEKDFETPLGVVKTDRDFVRRLAHNASVDYFRDELLHRTEHVIEFQLVWLQHLYGTGHPFTIVPVLCAFDPEMFFRPDCRNHVSIFREFTHNLRDVVAKSEGTTCFIASVDLDHVGPRYGDNFQPDETTVQGCLAADRKLAESLAGGDGDAFLSNARAMNPRHRICGFSPLFTLLNGASLGPGKLLHLDYAFMDEQKSLVTFAGMVFS